MDTIPPEILAHIVNSLPGVWGWFSRDAKLAQYSPISRAWKASIERITFHDLIITTDELDAFVALFSGENISRWADLTSLTVTFILPIPPNATGCCPVEQPPDREADSVAFSASMVKLFTILADLAARATEKRPLSLCIENGHRLSKFDGPKPTIFETCKNPDGAHWKRKIEEAQAVSGQFELIHENLVPILHGITTLQCIGGYDLIYLKPTWIPSIVAKLPDLERFLHRTDDEYSFGRRRRIAQRQCLLESIRNLPGNHLREIRLNIQSSSMRNENLPAHKLVDNGKWSQESWFCMLNHLASLPNLVVLELLGGLVICPEFFRGIVDYPGTPFPSLVEFELQFAPETADGKWFYERDDDALERSRNDPKYDEFWEEEDENEEDVEGDAWSIYSNEEYNSDEYVSVFEDGPFCRKLISRNRFRSLPSTITFLPFLMDSSKAASRIPTLQKFILKLGEDSTRRGDLNYFPVVSRVFELWYLKAGMHRTPLNTPMPNPYVPRDAAYLNQNRIYWRIDGTKPWDDVQAAWGAIAGPDAKIVFLEEDQWTKHVNNSYVYIYKGEF